MNTNELIAESRWHVPHAGSPDDNWCIHCADEWPCVTRRLADALEAATRVPVQGEPNDDRERLARLLAAQDGEEWDRLVGTAEYARNRYLRKAGAILKMIPSLSRAAVPDAATGQVTEYSHLGYDEASRKEIVAAKLGAEGERDSYKAQYDAATTEMEHLREGVSAWKEGYDLQTAELVKISAERDAALAAVERVRAAVNGPHPANSGLDSFTLAHISAALDGAPEPEGKR